MISWIVISSLVGTIAIVSSEILRNKKIISNESSRKVLHIAHGLVVASWVFVTNYNFIIAAEVLFLAAVIVARKIDILRPLRTVGRKSWGDYFFPIGIIVLAMVNPTNEVFFASVLHLGLADAVAALVGRKFTRGEYRVFGQRKTIAGSFAFLITSAAIVYYFTSFLVPGTSQAAIIIIPLIVMLTENVSAYGSDNASITLVAALLLDLYSPGVGI